MKLSTTLITLMLILGAGCFSSEVHTGPPRWPNWLDGVAAICSGQAARNINYIHKRERGFYTDPDGDIIRSDTRFYLGLVEVLAQKKAEWALEQDYLEKFGGR